MPEGKDDFQTFDQTAVDELPVKRSKREVEGSTAEEETEEIIYAYLNSAVPGKQPDNQLDDRDETGKSYESAV